jgi:hypothetical protein
VVNEIAKACYEANRCFHGGRPWWLLSRRRKADVLASVKYLMYQIAAHTEPASGFNPDFDERLAFYLQVSIVGAAVQALKDDIT